MRGYFAETRTAFPDQRNELIALHHADDARDRRVRPQGHPPGPLRDLEPTGKEFTCRMVAFFLFDGDRLVCERVYFDAATIAAPAGVCPPGRRLDGEGALHARLGMAGHGERNWYLPGVRSTEMVDTPPPLTSLPVALP